MGHNLYFETHWVEIRPLFLRSSLSGSSMGKSWKNALCVLIQVWAQCLGALRWEHGLASATRWGWGRLLGKPSWSEDLESVPWRLCRSLPSRRKWQEDSPSAGIAGVNLASLGNWRGDEYDFLGTARSEGARRGWRPGPWEILTFTKPCREDATKRS